MATEAQIKQCQDDLAKETKCKSEAEDLADCMKSKAVCKDDVTDGLATLAACAKEGEAYTTCQSK